MSTITFRQANHADIPSIVCLVESAYRGDASRVGWTTEANILEGQRIDVDGVRTAIDAPNSLVLLANDSTTEQLLACCHLEKKDQAAYFGMFSVNPASQGTGIGKAVLVEAERLATTQWQCQRMEMTVIDIRDELIAFYIRHGYHRTGKHLPFPYGDERFGIPLRDDLRFEVLEKQLA